MSYIGPKIAQKQQQSVSQSILPKVNTIRNRIKRTMQREIYHEQRQFPRNIQILRLFVVCVCVTGEFLILFLEYG